MRLYTFYNTKNNSLNIIGCKSGFYELRYTIGIHIPETILKLTTMKPRIATFLIALCIFVSGTAFAINPVNQKSNASEAVAKLLKQELKYPKYAQHEKYECFVLARISITDDGLLKVECINCPCPRMKIHLKKAIAEIGTEEFKKYAGQEFNFRLNFTLI